MSIFTKNFEEISFSDIESLVENKTRESQVLEYKEKYNNNQTDKLISAFANTHGGFIIYGVKSNSDNNEPTEIVKLENNNLEDTIDNVCYDSIEPYISCQSKYLENDDKTKRVFIVNVPESDLTPHAIDNNSTVYIKVNAQKRPIEKATLEQQEWLKGRRIKSEMFRDKLIKNVEFHSSKICDTFQHKEFLLETSIVPQYPKKPLLNYVDLYSFAYKQISSFNEKFNTIISTYRPFQYNNGLCSVVENDNGKVRIYFELNCYGLCVIKLIFPWVGEPEPNQKYLRTDEVISNLVYFLNLLLEINNSFNSHGSSIVGCKIENIKDTTLLGIPTYDDLGSKIDNQLEIIRRFKKYDSHSCQFLIEEFYSKLLFVYNVHNNIANMVSEKVSGIFSQYELEYKENNECSVLI